MGEQGSNRAGGVSTQDSTRDSNELREIPYNEWIAERIDRVRHIFACSSQYDEGTRELAGWFLALAQRYERASKASMLRQEVWLFAQAMEAKLRANDHKGGWKNERPRELMRRLREEVAELGDLVPHMLDECGAEELAKFRVRVMAVLAEAADVANFSMMLADVAGGLRR